MPTPYNAPYKRAQRASRYRNWRWVDTKDLDEVSSERRERRASGLSARQWRKMRRGVRAALAVKNRDRRDLLSRPKPIETD